MLAAKKASALEEAMARLQVGTRASNEEMAAFDRRLSHVANLTGVFSKPKLADFGAAMREGGIMNIKSISDLIEPFAKGADVMQLLAHMSPKQSVHAFTALAHQQAIYDKQRMMPVIDAAVSLGPSTPGGVDTFKKWGAALVGVRNMHLEYQKQFALISAITQTSGSGGTGRSGLTATNLMNVFSRILPGNFGSGLLKGKSAFALHAMGLSDSHGVSTVMKDNKLDLNALMSKLAATTKLSESASGRMQLAKLIQSQEKILGKKAGSDVDALVARTLSTKGIGVSGAQMVAMLNQFAFGSAKGIATLLGDKAFQAQYAQLAKISMNSAGETERQQKALSQTNAFQEMRASTNIETLMSSFGKAVLPSMKRLMVMIADTADRINSFVEQHPRITQTIAALTAAGAGLLMIGGAANIAKAGIMGLKLLGAPIVSTIGNAVVKALPFMRVIPGIGQAAIAITALTLVMQNWDKIVGFAKQHVDVLKFGLTVFADGSNLAALALKKLVGALSLIGGAIGGFINGVATKLNLPQLPSFNLPKWMNDYSNQRLAEKGWLKGIDEWAAPMGPPASLAAASVPIDNRKVIPIASARGGSNQAAVHHHHTMNIHPGAIVVNGARGQSPEQIAEHTAKHIINRISHASSASSGSSVGRPLGTNGNYRS